MKGFPHTERILLRWGDEDRYGHVNNARYFSFMESARMGYLAAIDLDRFEIETVGVALVATNCSFRKQLHYPGELEVGARVERIGNRSFTMAYQIVELESGGVAADGEGVIAWADLAAGKSLPVPDELRRAIEDFEGRSFAAS